MFTGIVQTIGKIIATELQNGCFNLKITPQDVFNDLVIGESIAVNGVCLTVTDFTNHYFAVTVVPETLRCSNLKNIKLNDTVNLERSLQVNSRLGGHFVQGHVDGIGKIVDITTDNSDALLVKIAIDPSLAKYIVPKGFITLDGMSITVIQAHTDWFNVTLIPHTLQNTIAKHYQLNHSINIELDMLGKYIEKLLGVYSHANLYRAS